MFDAPSGFSVPNSLGDWLGALAAGGELWVGPFEAPAPEVDAAARAVLRAAFDDAVEELAGTPPEFDADAAGWAAVSFFRACQLLVCRDVQAETVTRTLAEPCPVRRGPGTDFSVDLVFRFLPDLCERARRAAPGDALVVALTAWAREWPLSSPGVALEAPPRLETFADSPALWRLYLDRVAARRSDDRWRDPRVAAQLRADLGAWPELAPAMAESLRRAALAPAISVSAHPALSPLS